LQSRVFPDLVEAEFLSSAKFSQRLKRDVQADLVSVLEAIYDGARRRREPHRDAFYAPFDDAVRARCSRESHDPNGWVLKPRECGLAVDSQPHLAWQLSPDTVNAQSGHQTDDAVWNTCCNVSQRVMFSRFSIRSHIQATSHTREVSTFDETAKILGMNTLRLKLAKADKALSATLSDDLIRRWHDV
jgi:hypothetical protein